MSATGMLGGDAHVRAQWPATIAIDDARGQRNPGVGWCRQRRRDAGNNFERHVGAAEREGFLGAAAEDEWIPAFEADDGAASTCEYDQVSLNNRLVGLRTMPDLSDVNRACVRVAFGENLGADQVIVQYDVGVANQFERANRQQSWIARAGADQVHGAAGNRSQISAQSHRAA